MILEILIFICTFLLAYLIYQYKSIHWHFDSKGVKYLSGYPFFGNVIKSTFAKRHPVDDLEEVYKAFPNERYVGYIDATTPIIMIRDPELIKQITVKDFEHFVDHKVFIPEDIEPLLGGSVFSMKGDRWRDMRATLSPAFTGSKMRQMMPFMTETSNNIVEYLKENLTPNEDLDVNDMVHRYTTDVIASAGFGLQVNSLREKDNEFYKNGQLVTNFDFWQGVAFMLGGICPKLLKLLGLKIFPEKSDRFFRNLVTETMAFREKSNVKRPDMIQLLMESSKGNLNVSAAENDDVGFATVQEELKPQGKIRDWGMDELTGQVFIFFAAGFETSAGTLSMCIHELAINPDIQEKLFQEIRKFNETHENLTYENVNELKYLDCVINETLRKWSPAIMLDRMCTKEYTLPPPAEGGKPFLLKPGNLVYNMVNTIHLDPKHYPNPQKFDPERFSDENKHKIKPFTFMPFGMGPRNCIASRFALLEIKVLMYNLTKNFKLLKGPKTSESLKLAPGSFNISAEGGSYIRLETRG